MYPETTVRRSEFYFDDQTFLLDKTCFFICGKDLKYLEAFLTSKIIEVYLERECRLLGKNSIQYSKQWMENIPIPYVSEEIKNSIEEKIELIIVAKEEHLNSSVVSLASEINQLFYRLYNLSPEEIEFIESQQIQ